MQPFDLIAAEHGTIPVRVVGMRGLHGVLKLEGRKTKIELQSSKFFHFETDDNGWCDIALLGPRGLKITAHNAVFSGTGQSWGRGRTRMHHASIFPNMLIMDSRAHSAEKTVAQISFSLMGLNDFFNYQYTEELNSFDLNDDTKSTLKNLRYSDENKLDSFDLSHIYICHRPKEVLKFKVDDRDYSIWSGGRASGLDWHGINLSIEHGGTIQFKAPVALDEALDRVYEWRQFFNQMAMAPLPITALSVAATKHQRAVIGDIYSPYLAESKPMRSGLYGLHPARLPLNEWKDRSKLARSMESWLKKTPSRRPFRARLDTVIEHMQEGSSQSDIPELCAGIDSLDELKQKSEFSDALLERMASAAFETLPSSQTSVTAERLKGILGLLQHRSLSEKMKTLASETFPVNYALDTEAVIRLANTMRQDAVHRAVVRDQLYPALQSVADALACMCVAFDLGSSGIPLFEQEERNANCIGRFFNCMMQLRSSSHVSR